MMTIRFVDGKYAGRTMTLDEYTKELFASIMDRFPYERLLNEAKKVVEDLEQYGIAVIEKHDEEKDEEPGLRKAVVKLRKWLAAEKGCPVIMQGTVLRETAKAIYFKGHGHFDEVHCCICGRELTNPVSIRLGVGPICLEKYGIEFSHEVDGLTDEEVRRVRAQVYEIKWEGWLPKSQIEEVSG